MKTYVGKSSISKLIELIIEKLKDLDNRVNKNAQDVETAKNVLMYKHITTANKEELLTTRGNCLFEVDPGIVDGYTTADMCILQMDAGIDMWQICIVDKGETIGIRQNDMSSGNTEFPLHFNTLTSNVKDLELKGNTRNIKFVNDIYTKNVISLYKGDKNGSGLVIESGGRTIIGSGEAAANLRTALGTGTVDECKEVLHLASDVDTFIYSNCQTIANRKTFTFAADGSLTVPNGVKANATSADKVNNALTFTGAVEETYDGSTPVTINIPSFECKTPSSNDLSSGSNYDMIEFNKQKLLSIGKLNVLYLSFSLAKVMTDKIQYEICRFSNGINNNYFDAKIYACSQKGIPVEISINSNNILLTGNSKLEVGDYISFQYTFLSM